MRRSRGPSDLALRRRAQQVGRALLARGWHIVTAESCTAGWVTKVLTDISGSSGWVDSGYVVYSNAAKMRDLGVSGATLRRHGAVSEATVLAMARGAQRRTGAELSIAISGIAGPDGGTAEKPVGTVWFGLAYRRRGARSEAMVKIFAGNRDAVRRQCVDFALQLILQHAPP